MENCIFCKIVAGEIPSPRLYEDDEMIVIKDIEPKAKLHYLCIPKMHFTFFSADDEKKIEAVKHCFAVIPAIAEKLGLKDGYRVIVNQGENGGQTVPHLHIHLLGGEKLGDF